MKTRFLLAIAAGVLLIGFAATGAQAGPVQVTEDGGQFNFTLTSTGTPGTVTISFSDVTLSEVNGVVLGTTIASSLSTLTLATTKDSGPGAPPSNLYTFSMVGLGNTKTFGPTVGSQAILDYDLPGKGNAIALTSGGTGFLNASGTIPMGSVLANALPGLDFSPFDLGGTIGLTFNEVRTDIGFIVANGGTFTGAGGFTEAAVPEPGSFALLGVGMTGFLAFRRFFKKTSVA
jgi:PEP-CTERM motif